MDYSALNSSKVDASTASANAAAAAAINGSNAGKASSTQGSQESFLKLLVTQMQNQDPLSPMDNAQVTSQIAQINTVQGIGTLNTTVASLNSQFLQMQSLQGASLVGRSVVLEGNTLSVDSTTKTGKGVYQLDSAADNVKLEVLSAAGQVVSSTSLGAESSGTHDFSVDTSGIANQSGLTFRITATSGAKAVTSTTMVRDTVDSVGLNGDTLTLDLAKAGSVAYSKIKSFE